MGKASSKQKYASPDIEVSIPSTEYKNRDNSGQSVKSSQTSSTCSLFSLCLPKKSKPIVNDSIWKRYMIEQLNNVNQEAWPQLLISVLERYNEGSLESTYKSEMVWARQHPKNLLSEDYSISSVESQKKRKTLDNKNQEENNSFNQSLLLGSYESQMGEAVQNLLNTSHILDENILPNQHRRTVMNSSCNGNVPKNNEDLRHSLKTLFMSTRVKSNLDNPEKKSAEVDNFRKNEKLRKTKSSKKIPKYRNNVFLNSVFRKSLNNETENLYDMIMSYKTITDVIDKHLSQRQNIFSLLIQNFEKYYDNTYTPIIQKGKDNKIQKEELEMYIDRATSDFQQFIIVICEGVCVFYEIEGFDKEAQSNSEFLFNRDNLFSFFSSIVFTDALHDILFELLKFEDKSLEEIYEKNLKKSNTMNPEDFGVPDEYCLNSKTMEYFKMNHVSRVSSEKSVSTVKDEVMYFGTSLSPANKKSSQDSQGSTILKPETRNIGMPTSFQPYKETIDILGALKYRKGPIHKLKTIVKAAESINNSIKAFYENIGIAHTRKPDPDQTLSIFLFILAKCELYGLITHCKIIQKFSTNNILNSVSGYYAITLEACVNCICSMTFSNLKESVGLEPSFERLVHSVGSCLNDFTSK